MALMSLNPNPQGRSGKVASEPLEIVDPPVLFTEDVLRRFPSLMAKQAEHAAWWEKHKTLLISMRQQLEALTKKVNAT